MTDRLLLLTALCSLLLATACLPDEVTVGSPEIAGFSDPQSTAFNARELTVLREHLAIDPAIETAVVRLPRHIAASVGVSTEIAGTFSDAKKALLGRVLFYDKQLSATGETSCATCHEQDKAFSDDLAFSDGINGGKTKRNSIALGSVPTFAPTISGYGSSEDDNNAAVEGRVKFFWDERAGTVKEQSIATIQDEIEMGRDLEELAADLRRQELYRILTVKAFGTTDLTPDRLTLALEKFTASITSMNTRFDRFQDRFFFEDISGDFSAEEILGQELFNVNCASCHSHTLTEPLVAVANNGLDASYADKGVGQLTGNVAENGVFKVPFLRNVALTAPYMHDGRFRTLREVVDHYSEGIQDHRNLHPNLRNGGDNSARRMNFSEAEKAALIAFLRTTTDETMLTDPRLSDPFRR